MADEVLAANEKPLDTPLLYTSTDEPDKWKGLEGPFMLSELRPKSPNPDYDPKHWAHGKRNSDGRLIKPFKKEPTSPSGQTPVSFKDDEHWFDTYDEALTGWEKLTQEFPDRHFAISYVVRPDSPVAVYDLDDCIDPETGTPNDSAMGVVAGIFLNDPQTRTAYSSSGTGLHVFVSANGTHPPFPNNFGSKELGTGIEVFGGPEGKPGHVVLGSLVEGSPQSSGIAFTAQRNVRQIVGDPKDEQPYETETSVRDTDPDAEYGEIDDNQTGGYPVSTLSGSPFHKFNSCVLANRKNVEAFADGALSHLDWKPYGNYVRAQLPSRSNGVELYPASAKGKGGVKYGHAGCTPIDLIIAQHPDPVFADFQARHPRLDDFINDGGKIGNPKLAYNALRIGADAFGMTPEDFGWVSPGRYANGPSELEAAELFAKRYSDSHAHCLLESVWSYWDGSAWRRDERGARATRALTDMLKSLMGDDGKKRKAMGRGGYIANILTLATKQLAVGVQPDKWNRHDRFFPFKNVTYDLETGEAIQPDPKHRFNKCGNVEPRPMKTPTADRVVAHLAKNNSGVEKFIWQILAIQLLDGNPHKIVPIFRGPADCGKTKLIEVVQHIMGDFARVAPGDVFQKYRGHADKEAVFSEVRMAFIDELSDQSRSLCGERFKQLTGGENMNVEKKYLSNREGKITASPIIATNNMPRVDGADSGLASRLAIIETGGSIPRNQHIPDLPQKLREEAPGIANRLIQELAELDGEAPERPPEVLAATKNFLELHDPVATIGQELILETGSTQDHVVTADLVEAINNRIQCSSSKHRVPNVCESDVNAYAAKQGWTAKRRRRRGTDRRSSPLAGYIGIQIIEPGFDSDGGTA